MQMERNKKQTNERNDRAKTSMKNPVNGKSENLITTTKIKAERPVCESTTVVLGAIDAVTSQIKITCHRGGGGVAGVVGGRVTPFLACS